MALPVLIIGESGSGKSASIRNFQRGEVGIINPAKKRLPFRNNFKTLDTSDYQAIVNTLSKCKAKAIVIDDSQYLMAFENFAKAKEIGYTKYTDMALHFYNLIKFCIDEVQDDKIVYFLHHPETDSNTGKCKAKTLGKMLDNQLTVEGLFSIVLWCVTDGKTHNFITQSDGFTTAKSPMEMFPVVIDNDLKMVDATIREYYNMEPLIKVEQNG